LHDAKIELARIIDDMEDILAPRMLQQFRKVITKIRAGLLDVNTQKDNLWQKRYNHYSDLKNEHGMKTVWSIFEVDDLESLSMITATELKYNGWGEATIKMAPGNKSYMELWNYAEQVLYEADDMEHSFIESFTQAGDICILGTGS
jgi:lipopolysaccharide export LptBFGC system permease protein LptF